MAFCKNCGTQIDERAVICPKCGVPQEYSVPAAADHGGFGWGLLGFCIPIVGLILFLVWRGTRPKSGKAAGIGALIAAIIVAVVSLIAIVFGAGLLGAGISMM